MSDAEPFLNMADRTGTIAYGRMAEPKFEADRVRLALLARHTRPTCESEKLSILVMKMSG